MQQENYGLKIIVVLQITMCLFVAFSSQDIEVYCDFMQSCTLPCSSPVGAAAIEWTHLTSGANVHLYLENQDQLRHQDVRFRGRTSLFSDQIPEGNASLLLTGVKVEDQGEYECIIISNGGLKKSVLNLKVDAPVHEMNIYQENNSIICSSEGIYPQPELTWSTVPPCNTALQTRTTVRQTEEKLYDISSSLVFPDSELTYSCTVTNHKNKRSANLRPGTAVSCRFTESCILPCSFSNGDELVLHWFYTHGGLQVHSFYQGQDQLGNQDRRFKNRTSLFKDQIPRQNYSLKLTGVKVEDEGRYECLMSSTTGDKDSYIDLKVEAPVTKVSISQVENRIVCSSERIYPQPELTWSTDLSSNTSLETTVQQNEEKLYNISSSLIVPDNTTDVTYSCTVSTQSNKKRATMRRLSAASATSRTTIPCAASNRSRKSLIWRFNQDQMILNQTRSGLPLRVSDAWRKHVEGVSASGSLTLQDMTSQLEGVYTCELSDEDGTTVTNISVRVSPESPAAVRGVVIGLVVAVAVLIIGAVILLVKRRKNAAAAGGAAATQDVELQRPEHEAPPPALAD